MEQRDFNRAIEVREALARRGQHRAVALPDLLIAAVAERAALCVLHCDEDYDRIATVTNQSVQYEGTPYLPSRPYIWLDRALGTYRLRILSK